MRRFGRRLTHSVQKLFIGSEGTLGIITGVAIKAPPRSSAINVALLSVDSFERVQEVFVEARKFCAEILSAFEFFDQSAHDMVMKHLGQDPPLAEAGKNAFYILIETSGSNKEHDDAKLEALLDHLMTGQLVTDGTLAQDETQLQSIWSFRESIPEAAGKLGKTYKYDLSMPVSKMCVERGWDKLTHTGTSSSGTREGASKTSD